MPTNDCKNSRRVRFRAEESLLPTISVPSPHPSTGMPERLAQRMPLGDRSLGQLQVLNGLRPGEPLAAGQRPATTAPSYGATA